jgi:magnesium chelatase family protein
MLAKTHSAQLIGLRADILDVEVDLSRGLHSFTIVGLADKAVDEAKDRISAAIKNSGFPSPQKSNKRVVVSLAPADVRKEGTGLDLAIALAYLLAEQTVKFTSSNKLFLGELGLDGTVRPIRGTLMMTRKAKEAGIEEIYVPQANASEAALVTGIKVYGVRSLRELVQHLDSKQEGATTIAVQPVTEIDYTPSEQLLDFADIKSQPTAKRGLEIAAAGGHNLAMSGPPGTGKTMLAKAFSTILPPLSFDEVLETTGIYSAAGYLAEQLITQPPFRAPHHTASYISLVGGGNWPKPGEITLAHRGVLFLDEFAEFEKRVIEALRQPLEDRIITVSRARGSSTFPANFILITAMNPCPCGYAGSKIKPCICSPNSLYRYQRKISGPIIDRIDLWLDVPAVEHHKLSGGDEESSAKVRHRVLAARARQRTRFKQVGINKSTNSALTVRELKTFAPLTASSLQLLNDSAKRLNLSARAYHRVIKLARTIADLANVADITDEHLLEALHYRPKQVMS